MLFASYPINELLYSNRLIHRLSNQKPTIELIDHQQSIPSFLRSKYELFYHDLMKRLRVNMTLLDYNYTRLKQHMNRLKHQWIHIYGFFPEEVEQIVEEEYPLALEYYLQFDIDLFFMKTCCYRDAIVRSVNEGLLAQQEPEARYGFIDCGNCGLCYPRQDRLGHSRTSLVIYQQAHEYSCLNGYRIILNAPASCSTTNIVYILKCLCNEYEYIGVTMYSLKQRLQQHRRHNNRIMHEFLMGEQNVQRNLIQPKSNEILRKDRMKLYQHSTQCRIAWQYFLDRNPEYWPFIPMSIDSMNNRQQSIIDEQQIKRRSYEEARIYVDALPKPPTGFIFTEQQKREQLRFFQLKKDMIAFDLDTDLYRSSVISVLPEKCSNGFRCLIESMFITVANTKLNSIGNLNHTIESSKFDGFWCRGLIRNHDNK